MSSINKIKLPDNIEYDINDVRIPENQTPATQEWAMQNVDTKINDLIEQGIDSTIPTPIEEFELVNGTDLSGKTINIQDVDWEAILDTTNITNFSTPPALVTFINGGSITISSGPYDLMLIDGHGSHNIYEWSFEESRYVRVMDSYTFESRAIATVSTEWSPSVAEILSQVFVFGNDTTYGLISSEEKAKLAAADGTIATQEWVDDQNYITLTEIPTVSETTDGLMSADDKSKLNKLMTEPALTLTFSSKPAEELPWITDSATVVWENDTTCKIYGITEINTNYPGVTEVSPLLTTVKFGSYVTRIGTYTFEGCSSLTSISIPNSVTSIGRYAFSGCSLLTSIVIPDSVTSIGNAAFYDCSSLTSVEIGDSVTEIGYGAFSGCTALESIEIPASILDEGISLNWFADTNNLKYIKFNHTTPILDADGNLPDIPTSVIEIIVPPQSIDAYKSAWPAYADKITAIATQAWVSDFTNATISGLPTFSFDETTGTLTIVSNSNS